MGICIPKYTAEHWTYSALQYWELHFFSLVLPRNKCIFKICCVVTGKLIYFWIKDGKYLMSVFVP